MNVKGLDLTPIPLTFELAENFDFTGLPSAMDLFPGRRDDPFYDALLDAKRSAGASSPLAEIPEYAWA
jgi:hypothetical protein